MKPKFIQANCVEGKHIDMRQADVVSLYKPDMIFFEMPSRNGDPSLIFNKYSAKNKPLIKVRQIKNNLEIDAKKYPYALSDVAVWENIEKLWKEGQNTLLFNIDGPKKLRAHRHELYGHIPYPALVRSWWFWAYQLMREMEMKENIESILKNYKVKKRPVVTVFLQSIHWDHVQFLLTHPSRQAIWKYYFGKFPKVTPENIGVLLKEKDKVLYKYWLQLGF